MASGYGSLLTTGSQPSGHRHPCKTGLGVQSGAGSNPACRLFAPLELGWVFPARKRCQVASLGRGIPFALRDTV
ncbi:hypothetical protein Hanom_Chr09g00777001 [Helianthus anomalus]